MKFLEELKAAQAILGRFDVPPIDMVWDDAFFDVDELDSLAAVLRRIPHLIDALEWAEQRNKEMKEDAKKCFGDAGLMIVAGTIVFDELLSKLEGKKEEKPINGQSEQLTKEKEMNEEVMKLIKEMAIKEIASDEEDFMVNDYAGGNIDDAYYLGFEDGQVSFARSIVEALGGEKI